MPVNLLIIEPNALIRRTLHDFYGQGSGFSIIGKLHDASTIERRTLGVVPDILIFDAEDNFDDDVEALKTTFGGFLIPILFFSNKSETLLFEIANRLGSLDWDVIQKPSIKIVQNTTLLIPSITKKLRDLNSSAKMRIEALSKQKSTKLRHGKDIAYSTDADKYRYTSTEKQVPPNPKKRIISDNKIVAIGTSTGGTTALLNIFSSLPPDFPGIVAVIHMPVDFTGSFAARLDSLCEISVKEAKDGDLILPGQALLARGDKHLEVSNISGSFAVRVAGNHLVNGHCPSVDVLFSSVAQVIGQKAVGVILTGMGKDGANGLGEIKLAGGWTIAQNKSSSVVFGMPKVAIDEGHASSVYSLDDIPNELIKNLQGLDK